MESLGQRFKFLREKRGLSQLDLAQTLGVSQQAIQQVEGGKARKPRYLYEAANILQTSYEWLLFGQENFSYGQSKAYSSESGVSDNSGENNHSMIKIIELSVSEGGFFDCDGGYRRYDPAAEAA